MAFGRTPSYLQTNAPYVGQYHWKGRRRARVRVEAGSTSEEIVLEVSGKVRAMPVSDFLSSVYPNLEAETRPWSEWNPAHITSRLRGRRADKH